VSKRFLILSEAKDLICRFRKAAAKVPRYARDEEG